VPVELRPSTELTHADLAELLTAAYEGYFVPFMVDEPTFGFMVDVFDLDLAGSLVAIVDGAPVGLANLGLRGTRSWLGGVGVVPSRRGEGIGELLTRGLLEWAKAVGAREMALEVIGENGPAIALYEKLGFERTRELEVLSLALEESAAAADEATVEAARALVRAERDAAEPWQRDDDTVDRLVARDPAPMALVGGDAAAVYRLTGETVSLVQAAGDRPGLQAILAALRSRGTVSAVNIRRAARLRPLSTPQTRASSSASTRWRSGSRSARASSRRRASPRPGRGRPPSSARPNRASPRGGRSC
jgi:ribosomal protein S18 acetylase RimI-like enzyme